MVVLALVFISGYRQRWVAVGLMVLLGVTTIGGHAFWRERGDSRDRETTHFLKNTAIIASCTVVITLILAVPAAYALARLRFRNAENIGIGIVKRALEEPLRQIVANAGHEGAVVVDKVRSNKSANYGFNAETEEYGDMLAMGVVDPTKVTRYALQNAASIAGLLLTTEALISEMPEQEKEAPQMPGGGGMGGF